MNIDNKQRNSIDLPRNIMNTARDESVVSEFRYLRTQSTSNTNEAATSISRFTSCAIPAEEVVTRIQRKQVSINTMGLLKTNYVVLDRQLCNTPQLCCQFLPSSRNTPTEPRTIPTNNPEIPTVEIPTKLPL